MAKSCTWAQDEEGVWQSSCGCSFILNEGTPSENKMAFCCYCGKAIKEVQHKESEHGK